MTRVSTHTSRTIRPAVCTALAALLSMAVITCSSGGDDLDKDLGTGVLEVTPPADTGLTDVFDVEPVDFREPDQHRSEIQYVDSVETAHIDSHDSVPPECGNGFCTADIGEDCMTCPQDCGKCTVCGDGICEPGHPVEGPDVCPEDCGGCGDGVCGKWELEHQTCGQDCLAACGDTKCNGMETGVEGQGDYCPLDCGVCFDGVCSYQELFNPDFASCKGEDCSPDCGNGFCDPDETPEGCTWDCAMCGDGICSTVGLDLQENCPQDCVKPCGDGLCEGDEDGAGCPVDCGPCGDGICSLLEVLAACCPIDCPPECGNGDCDQDETEISCPIDCACLPDCNEEWECGEDDNGCGETCAVCPEGTVCVEHSCCVPDCGGKLCGDDGCGGTCGECVEPFDCVDNWCVCQPDCAGKECGDDGCLGQCGQCNDALFCTEDVCQEGACSFSLLDNHCLVEGNCVNEGAKNPANLCEFCNSLSPASWSSFPPGSTCGPGMQCISGQCCDPVANCKDKECGPGTCAGSCGNCLLGSECADGVCHQKDCEWDCAGKECGEDGCGGNCGTCDDGQLCSIDSCDAGVCQHDPVFGYCLIDGECVPNGAKNPANLCVWCLATVSQTEWSIIGGSGMPCGTDDPSFVCFEGECCDSKAACEDKDCGNVCGFISCGSCTWPEVCTADNTCECQPDCDDNDCGNDGCGGNCGLCPPGESCDSGQCQCNAECGGSCGDCPGDQEVCAGGFCVCQPDCAGKECDGDGCGGTCGDCHGPQEACTDGLCICQPDCWDKQCGGDGCGGDCGTCGNGFECSPQAWCGVLCDDGNATLWDGCSFGVVSEALVNEWAAGDQRAPAVAVFPDGEYAVAWESVGQDGSGVGVYARIFSTDGTPQTDEFQVNETSQGVQQAPDVATLEDGNVVVVWSGNSAAGGGVVTRVFDGNGNSQTQEEKISLSNGEVTDSPSVAAGPGGHLVAWTEGDSFVEASSIAGRFFPSEGIAPDPVALSPADSFATDQASVAAFPDGKFVVAYHHCPMGSSGSPDGDGCGVYARMLSATGQPEGAEFILSEQTSGGQRQPRVAVRDAGVFSATWANENPVFVDDWNVLVRLFWAAGVPLGAGQTAWLTASDSTLTPAIDTLPGGASAVAWHLYQQGDQYDVLVRRFGTLGMPDGDPVRAHVWAQGHQSAPDVAIFPDENLVVVWESWDPDESSDGQDGDGKAVLSARFAPGGSPCEIGNCSTATP